MFSRFWLKIKTKTLKFLQMLQVSSSCNISIYIFNSICWSFLKKFFTQGPHCSHRSFTYNLVDGKHLKLLWQVFSHCFCWSDLKKKKQRARKQCEELKFLRINLKHPFEMRIAIKKHFGMRWWWGEQSLRWKYSSVKQMYLFDGDYIHCVLIYSSLLLFLRLFSATTHIMAPGSPEESQ